LHSKPIPLHLVQSYALLATRLLNVRGAWTAATGSTVAERSAVDSESRLVMIKALTLTGLELSYGVHNCGHAAATPA
jgi:hypothetical protein